MPRLSESDRAARDLIGPEDCELIDAYADEHPGTAWHVIAAFVLAGQEPPRTLGYTGTQSNLIKAHYEKYEPNGANSDGLEGVGPLERAK